MALVAVAPDPIAEAAEAAAEAAEEAMYGSYGWGEWRPQRRKKRAEWEWVFLDESGNDRFNHEGDTIVPGAGVRWKHCHRAPAKKKTSGTGAAGAGGAGSDSEYTDDSDAPDSSSESEESEPSDEESSDYDSDGSDDEASDVARALRMADKQRRQIAKRREKARKLQAKAERRAAKLKAKALVAAKDDDEDELPWQVIALLDMDIMQQLVWAARHRRRKVAEAVSGKDQPAPTPASLEGAAAQGRWLFRVVAPDGVELLETPFAGADVRGTREEGDYLRGIELTEGGRWLRLDAEEDTEAPEVPDRMYGAYHDAAYGRQELWVEVQREKRIGTGKKARTVTTTLLERVAAEDDAVTDKVVEDVVEDGVIGAEAELFDKPFVPRVEDVDTVDDEDTAALVEPGAIAESEKQAAMRAAAAAAFPVGTAVVIEGLTGGGSAAYNGAHGTVIAPLDTTRGRQGVRLEAPFSGKRIAVRPANIVFDHEAEASRAAANLPATPIVTDETGGAELLLHARALGLSPAELPELELGRPAEDTAAEGTAGSGASATFGFGLAGTTARERVSAALRAAQRDAWEDPSAVKAASTAHTALVDALDKAAVAAPAASATKAAHVPPPSPIAVAEDGDGNASGGAGGAAADDEKAPTMTAHVPPDVAVQNGALGPRAAAAARAAASTTSLVTASRGVDGLRGCLRDELRRLRGAGEKEGTDALRLRLVLTITMLNGHRNHDALSEATIAYDHHEASPAATFLRARCLLRTGKRGQGIDALEKAAGAAAMPVLDRDAEWGVAEAKRMLLAIRASEARRLRALDAYERGRFEDAAAGYAAALSCVEAGARDDKRGRATLLCNRAGCFRRARRLDDAVADCDRALQLFPRYARALFRKAACLLEGGKPTPAVKAFEALYRVDRDWPHLNDWLVRAHAAQRRADKQGIHEDGSEEEYGDFSDDEGTGRQDGRRGSGKQQASAGGAGGDAADSDPHSSATRLAKEADHYAVLSVTTDATEKQLKTAYRMMSLKYHPDRKGGSTAAFQRIAAAYQCLSDADERRKYDEGGDLKSRRAGDSDDSDADEEENKQSLREEIERKYYPERYEFWPFGDPFIQKRKRAERLRKREGKPAWHDPAADY